MKVFVEALRPFLATAQVVAYLLVLGRVFSSGLYRTYSWFTIYICYETVRTAGMAFIPLATNFYAHVFFVTQPFTWCLYLLVILELYQLALKNHAGIATFARRGLGLALALSTIISLATLAFESQQPDFNVLHTYVLIERLILGSMLIFLLFFTAFLAYFPVQLNRNIVTHTRIFACYFLVRTILLIFRNLIAGDHAYAINVAFSFLAAGVLVAWALLLSRAGEQIQRSTSFRRDPEVEERLIAQLNAINRTLLSSSKK